MRLCNAGSGTLIGKETSGREVWLPIWRAPVSYNELGVFFSEGRLTLGQRYARNGLDAARAVASFGYDRGIDCFQRVGIVRGRVGGDNYNTAISLGSWSASPNAEADLVTDFDPWLDSFRCAASADLAPSRAQRVLRRLESAIFDLCQQKGAAQLQSVLCALGEAEAVLARSAKWRTEAFQRPVPLLSPKWLKVGDDGTTEFRLAASLTGIFNASIGGFREHLEPVEIKGRLAEGRQQWVEWSDDPSSANNIVWSEADLENNLIAVLQRRCMEAIRCGARTIDGTQVFPGESRCYATLDDVSAFLRYEVDDERIAILVRGLSLLDWEKAYQEGACNLRHHGQEDSMPDATFALLKLCHSPHPIRESYVPLNATIARLAAAGRLGDATQLAARRLLGSSLPPAIRVSSRRGLSARRITAALLFPLTWADTKKLADRVLKSQMESV